MMERKVASSENCCTKSLVPYSSYRNMVGQCMVASWRTATCGERRNAGAAARTHLIEDSLAEIPRRSVVHGQAELNVAFVARLP